MRLSQWNWYTRLIQPLFIICKSWCAGEFCATTTMKLDFLSARKYAGESESIMYMWMQVKSGEFRWIQANSGEFRWNQVNSGKFRWIQGYMQLYLTISKVQRENPDFLLNTNSTLLNFSSWPPRLYSFSCSITSAASILSPPPLLLLLHLLLLLLLLLPLRVFAFPHSFSHSIFELSFFQL